LIRFQAAPAFHDGFIFELDSSTQELTFIVDNTWMFRKNGTDDKVFYKLDSATKKIAKKYSQPEFRITKTLSNTDFNQMNEALQYLIRNYVEDDGLGLDGISYFISIHQEDSIHKIIYHTPEPDASKINTIINVVDKNFSENIVARFAIENVKRYTGELDDYQILSRDPLYVRLYQSYFCDDNGYNAVIAKLPPADTIYIDFTNFDEYHDGCATEALQQKYPVVKSIVPPRIWLYGRYIFEYKEIIDWYYK
jgi:hypothetical protein